MTLIVLKSSMDGEIWFILFLIKEGAYLHFFSSCFDCFFACLFKSKKELSFWDSVTLRMSLLLFKNALYFRAKGTGLKVVRILLTDKWCEITELFFSFYLRLTTDSVGGLMAAVNDFSILFDHLFSSSASFFFLS
jgi:hypothetical protein